MTARPAPTSGVHAPPAAHTDEVCAGDAMGRTARAAITVAAVDDHPTLLLGVEALLAGHEPAIHLVGAEATVATLVASGLQPAVVLLDMRLADRSRPEDNVRALLDLGASVVVHTEGQQPSDAREALRAGACTVVLKGQPGQDLLEAVVAAADGVVHPTHELASLLSDEPWLDPQLSAREREVLNLYASNMPAKSVARRLGMGEGTVKTHLRRIKAKYTSTGREAGTKLDLRDRALEDGVYRPDVPRRPGGRRGGDGAVPAR